MYMYLPKVWGFNLIGPIFDHDPRVGICNKNASEKSDAPAPPMSISLRDWSFFRGRRAGGGSLSVMHGK